MIVCISLLLALQQTSFQDGILITDNTFDLFLKKVPTAIKPPVFQADWPRGKVNRERAESQPLLTKTDWTAH